MKQIRKNVFETNSSSTHSLVLSFDGELEKSILDNDGEFILGYFGEYGWEIETYYSQGDKLSYVLTAIKYFDEKYYKLLSEAIKEYTGMYLKYELEKDMRGHYDMGYIDHQSLGEFYEIFGGTDENFKTSVINFIFGSESYFETDNDNH